MLAEARALAQGLTLDINLVATAKRRKKLLVADMDSTIINVECLDELADMAGLKPKIAAITERAMRGELEFEAALRERVGMLKGLPLSARWSAPMPSACGSIPAPKTCSPPCAHTARIPCWSRAASAFSPRAWPRRRAFMPSAATHYWTTAQALTGEVGTPSWAAKPSCGRLEEAAATLKLDDAETLAVGDGANDLAMIQRAGLGVAYHAKPLVAAAAGVSIDHNDLLRCSICRDIATRGNRARLTL